MVQAHLSIGYTLPIPRCTTCNSVAWPDCSPILRFPVLGREKSLHCHAVGQPFRHGHGHIPSHPSAVALYRPLYLLVCCTFLLSYSHLVFLGEMNLRQCQVGAVMNAAVCFVASQFSLLLGIDCDRNSRHWLKYDQVACFFAAVACQFY